MAIAWMYREDYDRAGYLVLPKGNGRVPFVILETLLPLFALVGISIMQSPTRHAMIFYCAAVLLGEGFLYFGLEFVVQRSRAAARRLLTASIVYLPLLYGLSANLCNRPGDPMFRPRTAAGWLMYHKQKLGETHWQELTGTVDTPNLPNFLHSPKETLKQVP